MEACIANIIASGDGHAKSVPRRQLWAFQPRYKPSITIKKRMIRTIMAKNPWMEVEGYELLNIPLTTLTGMRTYIRGNDDKSRTNVSLPMADSDSLAQIS